MVDVCVPPVGGGRPEGDRSQGPGASGGGGPVLAADGSGVRKDQLFVFRALFVIDTQQLIDG